MACNCKHSRREIDVSRGKVWLEMCNNGKAVLCFIGKSDGAQFYTKKIIDAPEGIISVFERTGGEWVKVGEL